jgi:hypothetical protein
MQHRNQVWVKWVVAALAAGALSVVFINLLIDNMPKGEPQKVDGYVPWEEETLEVVESLPLQDGGRIKPLATYAGFKMLQLHGARSMKVEGKGGEEIKIKPTEWLMDSLFRPQFAVHLPTFRVDNSQVLEAIGVETKGRRDRYSYNDLLPGLDKMKQLAASYEQISRQDPKLLKPEEKQTLDQVYSIRTFEFLTGYMDFARNGLLPSSGAAEGRILPVSEVMAAEKLRPASES